LGEKCRAAGSCRHKKCGSSKGGPQLTSDGDWLEVTRDPQSINIDSVAARCFQEALQFDLARRPGRRTECDVPVYHVQEGLPEKTPNLAEKSKKVVYRGTVLLENAPIRTSPGAIELDCNPRLDPVFIGLMASVFAAFTVSNLTSRARNK
jgi:hypothetical protein